MNYKILACMMVYASMAYTSAQSRTRSSTVQSQPAWNSSPKINPRLISQQASVRSPEFAQRAQSSSPAPKTSRAKFSNHNQSNKSTNLAQTPYQKALQLAASTASKQAATHEPQRRSVAKTQSPLTPQAVHEKPAFSARSKSSSPMPTQPKAKAGYSGAHQPVSAVSTSAIKLGSAPVQAPVPKAPALVGAQSVHALAPILDQLTPHDQRQSMAKPDASQGGSSRSRMLQDLEDMVRTALRNQRDQLNTGQERVAGSALVQRDPSTVPAHENVSDDARTDEWRSAPPVDDAMQDQRMLSQNQPVEFVFIEDFSEDPVSMTPTSSEIRQNSQLQTMKRAERERADQRELERGNDPEAIRRYARNFIDYLSTIENQQERQARKQEFFDAMRTVRSKLEFDQIVLAVSEMEKLSNAVRQRADNFYHNSKSLPAPLRSDALERLMSNLDTHERYLFLRFLTDLEQQEQRERDLKLQEHVQTSLFNW